MDSSNIASLLKTYRRRSGLSQSQLAAAVQRDRSWLAHIERGDYAPTPEQAIRLAESLQLPADILLLALPVRESASEGEARMSRQLLRQFSSSWRHEYKGGVDVRPPGTVWGRLHEYLNSHVGDCAVRSKLKRLRLGCWEVAQVALALLDKGAQWAHLSWSSVGMPLALLDSEGYCINHLPRLCLVWSGRESSLALFGESFGTSPRYVPPLLAWTDRRDKLYLMIEGERLEDAGQAQKNGPLPRVITTRKSDRHRSLLQRLSLRGMSEELIDVWLDKLLQGRLG